jgi:hypothetical protein
VREGVSQLAEGINGLRNGFVDESKPARQSHLGAE